ncbi:MAG: hypothetical protein LBR44_05660 [Clostridiales Family XIII bacterium]|jgi:hypothetical protein|nr:hypothetical protein [Clostridiales Family XIII bacterium]
MGSEIIKYTARILDETKEDIVDLDNFYYETTGDIKYAERFEAAFYEAVQGLTHMPRLFAKWQGRDDVRRYNMMTHKVASCQVV